MNTNHLIAVLSLATSLTLQSQAQAVLTDSNLHTEPALPALPAAGGVINDSTFGTPILRLTDANDGSDCRNEYSYWPTVNVNSTRVKALCVISGVNRTKIWNFDPVNFRRGSELTMMPMQAQSSDPIWSGSNPDLIYGYSQANLLLSYNVSNQASTPIKDFSSLVSSGNMLQQMSMTPNDDIFAFHIVNSAWTPVGYIVWKRSTNTVLLNRTENGVDEVEIDKSGRYLTVVYTSGNVRVWDLQSGPTSTDLTWGIDGFFHHDAGIGTMLTNTNGGGNGVAYRQLSAPHAMTTLLTVNTSASRTMHFSMRANNEAWGLVSHYRDDGGSVAYPFDNEIFQVATDGSGQVRRLLHHRSVYNDYGDQPQASISPDGQFVAFTSNWGNANGRRDLFLAKIPAAPSGSSSVCDIDKSGSANVSDVQSAVNQALGTAACGTADINLDGRCTVVDVQRVVNAALGGACVSP